MRFIRKTGQWAVDERCKCGHRKSEHGSKVYMKGGVIVRLPFAGNCCAVGCECDCVQFRWAAWVYEDDAVGAV